MYPWYEDPRFSEKVLAKKEIRMNEVKDEKSDRCLADYQYLVSNYINPSSPYNSILLYFSTGVGKTTSATAIAENFIQWENRNVVVITRNNDLIRNFKNEILLVCSDYTTPEEKKILTGQDEEAKTPLYKKLRNNYSFMTQAMFIKDHESIKLSGKVVIIDEIHNMLGNDGYPALKKVLKKSKDYKLVLLSATPLSDSVKDAFELSNILNGIQPRTLLPVRGKLASSGYLKHDKGIENISIFEDDKIYGLSKEGLSVLRKTLTGKVVYLKPDLREFPRVIIEGEQISIGTYKSLVRVIKCRMSGFQNAIYNETVQADFGKDRKPFSKRLEAASSIAYPKIGDKIVIGKDGYVKYPNILRGMDNLKKYSTKLYHLVENIKKSQGKVLVYSKYVTHDGIDLIKRALSGNGIKSFASITGEKMTNERLNLLNKFNSPDNDDGKKIKVLLVSSVAAEGLNLKTVREVHIYEPAWNLSTIQQVIGRAVRRNSHSRLPVKDRTVSVFLYCAVSDDLSKSHDASKYIKATRKDMYIKEFERMVAQASFACALTAGRNIIRDKTQDGSRDCDYTKCEYTCDAKVPKDVDLSSYKVNLHNKELYKKIKDDMSRLLKEVDRIHIDGAVSKLKKYKKEDIISSLIVSREGVKVVGNYLVKVKPVKQAKDIAGIRPEKVDVGISGVVVDGKFKLVRRAGGKQKECVNYSIQELVDTSKLLKLSVPQNPKKKGLCAKLKSKLVGGDVAETVAKEVYGTVDNGKLKLSFVKGNAGKACESYSKDELQAVFGILKLSLPKKLKTKKAMCFKLKQHFIATKKP